MSNIDFTVSHKGKSYPLSLPSESTLEELQTELEELTSVPPPNQKLLYKGKKASVDVKATLEEAGIKPGVKVQLLGSTANEVGQLRQVENEFQRRERILRERASKSQPKVRTVPVNTVRQNNV